MIDTTVPNIQQIQAHLAEHPYLSEGGLPGARDAQVYFTIKQLPDVQNLPNTHYWYLFIRSFSDNLMKKWIEKSQISPNKEQEKKEKKDKKKQSQPIKKQSQPKVSEKIQQGDLFDDQTTKPQVKKQAPKKEAPKKKKPIAKSILIFDVKVYEQGTDLDLLKQKILKIQMDGLVWNKQPKKIEVAYGIQKLQMACVIEDDKILTDDIFEIIQKWEQVQSTDMVSMQKV